MARKIKAINEQVLKAKEKLAEVEKLKQEAEAEEKAIIEDAEKLIAEHTKANGLFCGVILDRQNLVAVLDLALRTGEPVKIPARCYVEE